MKSQVKNLKSSLVKVLVVLCSLTLVFNVNAQNNMSKKTKVTVLNIDTKGLTSDPEQMGNLVRLEVAKLDTFEVMDKYDVAYLIEKNNLKIANCYGKICIVEVGKTLNADKMITGSVMLLGEAIVITLHLIDVKSESIEKTVVREYLNLPKEIQVMLGMTLNSMFGKKNDEFANYALTKKNNYESSTNNPNATRLNLSGPRWGAIVYTGNNAARLSEKTDFGGFNMFPVMFQFGYQYEIQYLNEGNFQALFEFIPMISGLDQGKIIPSFTVMNGLRNNKNGLEFGFGPTLSVSHEARGYFQGGNWYLESEYIGDVPNPNKIVTRADSRGTLSINPGFILAVGKSFKSGKLNIPVNFYAKPSRDGWIFGASCGFNAKKNSK